MGLKLVQKPTESPLTLAEAKAHLRVDFSDDDTIIQAMLDASVDAAQKFMGRAIKPQTWDFIADEFPDADGFLEIPRPPLIDVLAVYYNDALGVEQTLDSAGYVVDRLNEPGRIYLASGASWPTISESEGSVRVRFKAGYNDSDSPSDQEIPASIKAAVLLQLGTLYENRESVAIGAPPIMMPWSAEQLLRQYRVNLSLA